MEQISLDVLKSSGLFNTLSEEEIGQLVQELTIVSYNANDMIVKEGDEGRELYIVASGEVLVYTETDDGHHVDLAKLSSESNEVFGEQALLPGRPSKRNANVKALTNVKLYCLAKPDFQNILSGDNPLKEQLIVLGEKQVHEKMVRASSMFRSIQFEELGDDWYTEEVIEDGQIVFSQGDPGNSFFFIVKGTAAVYKTEEGGQSPKLMIRLHAGQCFGELALLKQQPRAATVIANSELMVIRIDGKKFVALYDQTPEMRDHLQTLQRMYSLTGRGFVTQHAGMFMGKKAVTTIYQLVDGTKAIASHVVGEDLFTMSLSSTSEKEPSIYEFSSDEHGFSREVHVIEDRIVSVTVHGLWPELGKIQDRILDKLPVDNRILRTFKRTGSFELGATVMLEGDEQTICHCLQIKLGTLRQAYEDGSLSVAQLSEATGAGTVCGSCRPLLAKIMESTTWTSVTVSRIIQVAENIRTFRFMPVRQGLLKPGKPGQHILVQALIDGNWVQRPYTVSSSASETQYREITVKKEPNGFFSGWLFDKMGENPIIRISEPQGDYYENLEASTPIVCLVGGIGLTPGLAICRSLIDNGVGYQELYIDYSVNTSNQMAYVDEFEAAAKNHGNIHFNGRVTSETERCGQKDIKKLADRFPSANYFLCGPTRYQEAMEQYLTKTNVHFNKIHIEEFTPVGGKREEVVGEVEIGETGKGYLIVGLAAVTLFLFQDLFQLKWPWLEIAQNSENFKRWTGGLIMLFVAFQWYFPFLRMFGKKKEEARHYHLHKKSGALSPLIFYIHSTNFGYGFVFMLSIVYFSNTILGLFNEDMIEDAEKKKKYTFYWIIIHIILSLLTVGMMLYHAFVAFYYE